MQLWVNQLLLKGFTGSSLTSIVSKTGKIPFGERNTTRFPDGWNLKNLQSLLALRMQRLLLDMLMKENGGNQKIIKIYGMEILDYRIHSKLKHQKRVFFTTNPDEQKKQQAESASKHKFSMDSHVEDFASVFGRVEHCSQLIKLAQDGEEKQTKLTSIKKEMFEKYFSKDDFMNSIEALICSPSQDEKLVPDFFDVELGPRQEGGDYSRDIPPGSLQKLSGNLSSESAKKPENEAKPPTEAATPNTGSWWSKCGCCKKKSKEIERPVLASKSMQAESADVEIMAQEPHISIIPIKMRQEELKEQESEMGEPAKPSDLLLDRFKLKEVPWLIKKMQETQSFQDPNKLKFEISRLQLEHELKECDFSITMNASWDSQTDITILSSNKSLLLVPDFLMSALNFFKRPFSGKLRVTSESPPPVIMKAKERFNNYAPMIVHLYLDNTTLLLPTSYEEQECTFFKLNTNLYLRFEYKGDAYKGPGFSDLWTELDIVRCNEAMLPYQSLAMDYDNLGDDIVLARPVSEVLERRADSQNRNQQAPLGRKRAGQSTERGASRQRGVSYAPDEAKDDWHLDQARRSENRKKSSVKKERKDRKPAGSSIDSIMQGVSLIYQQRYETSLSSLDYPSLKPNYITKFSVVNKSSLNTDFSSSCQMYLPVVLIPGLEEAFKLLGDYSTYAAPEPPSKNSSAKDPTASYNQIYEVCIPQMMLIIIREYKGEELVRLNLSNNIMYLHKETKKKPLSRKSPSVRNGPFQKTLEADSQPFQITAGYFFGRLGVDYFNASITKYEPFVDPWNFEFDILKIRE